MPRTISSLFGDYSNLYSVWEESLNRSRRANVVSSNNNENNNHSDDEDTWESSWYNEETSANESVNENSESQNNENINFVNIENHNANENSERISPVFRVNYTVNPSISFSSAMRRNTTIETAILDEHRTPPSDNSYKFSCVTTCINCRQRTAKIFSGFVEHGTGRGHFHTIAGFCSEDCKNSFRQPDQFGCYGEYRFAYGLSDKYIGLIETLHDDNENRRNRR
jgi:hypothetical protein